MLCTVKLLISTPLNKGHLTTRDTFLVPFLYFIMLNDSSTMDNSIKRTNLQVPMVSVIEGLHCI